MLYLLGARREQRADARIAIVGSRNPTPQGLANARNSPAPSRRPDTRWSRGWRWAWTARPTKARWRGPSGRPARDHRRGRHRPGPRLPGRHLELAHRIAHAGLLVSEYPLGTPPLAADLT